MAEEKKETFGGRTQNEENSGEPSCGRGRMESKIETKDVRKAGHCSSGP